MAKKTTQLKQPFSFTRLFSKSFHAALNPDLLVLQGLTLTLSFLALVVFSIAMILSVGILTLLSIASGFFPLVIFVALFGIAGWVLGVMAINAFMSGVQFHLGMQAVTRKALDIHLAWKLSSARWRDALMVQGSIITLLLIIVIVSLIPLFFVPGSPGVLEVLSNPDELFSRAPVTLFILVLLYFWFQPFLVMAPPIAYFENVNPRMVARRAHAYVKPHYVQILAAFIMLIGITTFLTSVSKWISAFPLMVSNAPGTALTLVLFTVFAFGIQILTVLFSFSLSVCTQTLLYLHVGNPQPSNTFVTKGYFSNALSTMAHARPKHSPYLPVKWKTPARGKK